MYLHTEHGSDNSTDVFWNYGGHIWNNDGDTAILKNSLGEIISEYNY